MAKALRKTYTGDIGGGRIDMKEEWQLNSNLFILNPDFLIKMEFDDNTPNEIREKIANDVDGLIEEKKKGDEYL